MERDGVPASGYFAGLGGAGRKKVVEKLEGEAGDLGYATVAANGYCAMNAMNSR